MGVTHHGYNIPKMPGSGDVITISGDEKDVVCTLERAYHTTVAERSDDKEDEPPRDDPCKKKKQLLLTPRPATSGPEPRDGAMPPIT